MVIKGDTSLGPTIQSRRKDRKRENGNAEGFGKSGGHFLTLKRFFERRCSSTLKLFE